MKTHIISFTAMLLLTLAGCDRLGLDPEMQRLAGKYYSTRDSQSGVELKADGSFLFYGNAGAATGKYTIEGDTLLLKADQEAVVFRFIKRGNDLSRPNGEMYKKR